MTVNVDREVLEDLYIHREWTTRSIAEHLGVGHRTICRRLHQMGIRVREAGPKRHLRLRSMEWLYRQYVTLGKSTTKIASEIGASSSVVYGWLVEHGIQTRPRGGSLKGKTMSLVGRRRISAAKRGNCSGPDNPNWKGGYVDPTFAERRSYKAKQWRDAVKKRDGYQCVECCASDVVLHAHHLKSWSRFPNLRFDIDNGKTLCVPCHEKVHGFKFDVYHSHDKRPRARDALAG